jgi:hypothetical protein
LQLIHRYDIASKIGPNEEVTYEEIGRRCDLNDQDLRQILRLSIAFHIFEEPRAGLVKHSAVSRCLVDVPLANSWVGHFCEEVWPAEGRTADAISQWPGSQEPHETAFALASQSNRGLFDYFRHSPSSASRFSEAMRFLQTVPELNVAHLIRDLKWDDQRCPKLVVDVGGADGSVATALAQKFKSVSCIVQDVSTSTDTAIVSVELAGRLQFQHHDMFTEQPVKGADVYLLRSVLHDWSDKYAIKILRNLIPALKNRARVIVNEVCLPVPGMPPSSLAQLIR